MPAFDEGRNSAEASFERTWAVMTNDVQPLQEKQKHRTVLKYINFIIFHNLSL